MSNWKVILAALVIFLAGLFTGGALSRKFFPVQATPRAAQPGEAPFLPWQVREEYVRGLARDLSLNSEQEQKILDIITKSQEKVKGLFESIDPQMKAEMQQVRGAIDAVLTPEQRVQYEELRKKRFHFRDGDDRRRRRPPSKGDMQGPGEPPSGAPPPPVPQ